MKEIQVHSYLPFVHRRQRRELQTSFAQSLRHSLQSGPSCLQCAKSLRWNSVHGERVLYVVPATQSAFDPGPMGRKHVQRTICSGKTNPVKKDSAEWRPAVLRLSDRCFLSCLLGKPAHSSGSTSSLWIYKQRHYSICELIVFLFFLLCKYKKKNNSCNAFQWWHAGGISVSWSSFSSDFLHLDSPDSNLSRKPSTGFPLRHL